MDHFKNIYMIVTHTMFESQPSFFFLGNSILNKFADKKAWEVAKAYLYQGTKLSNWSWSFISLL